MDTLFSESSPLISGSSNNSELGQIINPDTNKSIGILQPIIESPKSEIPINNIFEINTQRRRSSLQIKNEIISQKSASKKKRPDLHIDIPCRRDSIERELFDMEEIRGAVENISAHKSTSSQRPLHKRLSNLVLKFSSRNNSLVNIYSPVASEMIIIDGQVFSFNMADLKGIVTNHNLGEGGFGVVAKYKHIPSEHTIAVKRVSVRLDVNLKRELNTLKEVRLLESPFIVEYFGSFKQNGEVWIAMELMKISFDKIINHVYKMQQSSIPEFIIQHMSYSILSALDVLNSKLNIIHRDVKPSNMLIGEHGEVKICDFGIAGPLVNSNAKTKGIGCRPYMAPERLNPLVQEYSIESDIWSFGISLLELITGDFPFSHAASQFDMWDMIVSGDPPQLPEASPQSNCLREFVNSCMQKNAKERPQFFTLLKMNFLSDYNYILGKAATVEWMKKII